VALGRQRAVRLGWCLRDCVGPQDAFATPHSLRKDRVNKIVALGAKTASSKAVGPVSALISDVRCWPFDSGRTGP